MPQTRVAADGVECNYVNLNARRIVCSSSQRISGSLFQANELDEIIATWADVCERTIPGLTVPTAQRAKATCGHVHSDTGGNNWKDHPVDKWRPLRSREVGPNARRSRVAWQEAALSFDRLRLSRRAVRCGFERRAITPLVTSSWRNIAFLSTPTQRRR